MNLLTKLRHALFNRPQPKVTRLDSPESTGMRIDELPPFTLKTADLMRFDPQVRIGLGARNGLLMAAQLTLLYSHKLRPPLASPERVGAVPCRDRSTRTGQ